GAQPGPAARGPRPAHGARLRGHGDRAGARRRPGRAWGYAAPALSGLGALALVAPLPLTVGQGLLVAGQVACLLGYRQLYLRQPAHAVSIEILGVVMALGAALLWLGGVAVPDLTPWLTGFLVLTIFGERLELSRIEALAAGAVSAPLAVGIAVGLLTGAVVSLLHPEAGFTLVSLALLAAAGWLAAKDVTRHTLHAHGLPRFVAVALLAGYAWLAVAGAIWALGGRSRPARPTTPSCTRSCSGSSSR
ncbi:hypothetical protein PU560_06545, partial [Georgenia sp. 10Sc9-8]|nr:hypothetical protein [Georgenia halotolerans]